ncbi:MAG: CoA-binding protein [Bacteroidota bacterium]
MSTAMSTDASLDLRAVLSDTRTVAVVGCSPRATQTSHRIARYLQEAGYRIVPVNPHHETLLGEPCYPNLTAVPSDVVVDIVNVFRRPVFTEGVVADAVARLEATGQRPVVWTQLGVHSAAAETLAAAHGLPYLANRCIMVDHMHLV